MWQYLSGILTIIGTYAVAVCGLVILTGFTGLFSLGHAGFMSIGAYSAAILNHYLGIPFIVVMVIGGLLASIVSVIVGYPTLRGKLSGDAFAIAMLGFAEAIRLLFANIYPFINGSFGLNYIPYENNQYTAIAIAAVCIFLTVNYVKSQHGKVALSIREDPVAAELIGVNVLKEKIKSLMISAFFCGMSGAMLAFYYTYIIPNTFSTVVSNDILTAVVLGGIGSVSGPIIATAVLLSLPEMLRFMAQWRLVIYGLVMVIVVLVKPSGLLGYREISSLRFARKFTAMLKGRRAKEEKL